MSKRTANLRLAAVALLSAAAVLAPAATLAVQGPEGQLGTVQGRAGAATFSIGASIGTVDGTAYERVYAPGVRNFKVSELKWDVENVATAGVQGRVDFGGRYRVNLGYWAAVSEGDGDMVDRDWLFLYTDDEDMWTHESRHPDTTLDSGSTIDLNLDVRAFTRGAFSLSGIVGIKRDKWKWSSRGGTYIYSLDRNEDGYYDPDEFRAYRGSFTDGQLVISYEQQYTIAYLGIGCAGTWGPFQLQGRFLYSPWVSAEDHDFHALRDPQLTFDGEFSGGSFLGFGLEGSYDFTPRFFAALSLYYQEISEITGDVKVTPPGDTYRDGGAVEIETGWAAATLGFRF